MTLAKVFGVVFLAVASPLVVIAITHNRKEIASWARTQGKRFTKAVGIEKRQKAKELRRAKQFASEI